MSKERFFDRDRMNEEISKAMKEIVSHLKEGNENKVVFKNSNKFLKMKIVMFLKTFKNKTIDNALNTGLIEFITNDIDTKIKSIKVIDTNLFSKNLDLVLYLEVENFFYYKIQIQDHIADDKISEKIHKVVEKINISIQKKLNNDEKIKNIKAFSKEASLNAFYDVKKEQSKYDERFIKEFESNCDNEDQSEHDKLIGNISVNDKTDLIEYKVILEELKSEFGDDYFNKIFSLLYIQAINNKGKWGPTGLYYFGTEDNAQKKLKVVYRKFYVLLTAQNLIQENNGFDEWIENIMNIEKSNSKNI